MHMASLRCCFGFCFDFFFQLVSRLFSPSVSQTVVQFKRLQLHGFSSYLACFFVQLTHTTQNLGQRI